MRLHIPATAAAILGAGGLGYWLAGPALVASVLLGAESACACAARLSDFSDRWANCAIANAAIHGKLAILFEGADGVMTEAVPTEIRTMSGAQTELMTEVVDPACGPFANARRSDLALREERKKASYEDLFVPGSFEDALAHSEAGARYRLDIEASKSGTSSKEARGA